MTIAFRGRHRARSVGLPTAGVPTANDTFRLSDGATLLLTTAQDGDRTGYVYPAAPFIQTTRSPPNR
jgi:C-terminal processing protease CtpA/Prc